MDIRGFTILINFKEFIQFISKRYLLWGEIIEMERPLNQPIPKVEAKIPLQISLATPELLANLTGWDVPFSRIQIMQKKINDGYQCYVATNDNQIGGYCFVTAKNEHDPRSGLVVRPKPNERYLFDLYVVKSLRNEGVAPALMLAIFQILKDEGIETALGTVRRNNRIMLMMSTVMLRFKPIRVSKYIKIWWFAFVINTRPWKV